MKLIFTIFFLINCSGLEHKKVDDNGILILSKGQRNSFNSKSHKSLAKKNVEKLIPKIKSRKFIIHFELSSDEILKSDIKKFEKFLINSKNLGVIKKISINGHTDSSGTAEINDSLSLSRGKSALKVIKEKLPQAQFEIEGFASKLPSKKPGDQYQRRAEIIISY